MPARISKLETNRQTGKTQVEAQRVSILDAAETLFLEKGLENTNMKDIAARTGITRVSLYRYFSDRDPIAFEIAVRMLKRIAAAAAGGEPITGLESFRDYVIRMIDQFYVLRPAYRYISMFDNLYDNHYPNTELADWYKAQIFALGWREWAAPDNRLGIDPSLSAMLLNSTMSFLEKMAARGELMSDEQEVSMDDELAFYKEMIQVYFNRLAAG